LSKLAENIIAVSQDDQLRTALNDQIVDAEETDDGSSEGRVLLRIHKARERNSRLAEKRKSETLKATGKLECEVCRHDFYRIYGEVGKAI
jgi:5-methylcytosine-specific restriction protein A